MSAPIPGDPVYLGSFLSNTHWYGVVGDGDTPAMQVATMEAVGQDAVIALDVLKGDKGDKGDPADIVQMQWDSTITAPSQLPQDLNATTDVGKAWWVNSMVYVWVGDHYIAKQMGSPGQPGPVPNITFTAERVPPGTGTTIVQSGTSANPILHLKVDAPAGPVGPADAITSATDYDNTLPPENGQVVTWNGTKSKWEASDFAAKHPMFYSMPEAAFTNFTGVAQRHSIGSWTIPAQDFAYVPYVTGHIKAAGVELDADPLIIGCEVRLGDPISGQLVGRGFGNISSWATITPHFSTTGDPNAAVSPDNGVAEVPAGTAMNIHVNLYNDGLLGAYIFQRAGSQLGILLVPQGA